MNDTWGHTLRMLQPDIDVLKEFMDRGPRIKPMLKFVKRIWVLEINIDWGMFDIQYGNPWIVEPLDTKVLWATQQLENWENVSRQAWNMWHFKHKRDAEKFITLYNLVWTE